MLKLSQKLKKEIESYNAEINALSKILQTADEQIAVLGFHSRTARVKSSIQDAITDMKKFKLEAETKLESYANMSRKSEMEIMYFQANHGDIRSDEWKKINQAIQKFASPPQLNEVDSGMSDEVVLYTAETVDDDEAQAIWDYLNAFMFTEDEEEDEDGSGIRFQPGEMFYWNGTDVKKTKAKN